MKLLLNVVISGLGRFCVCPPSYKDESFPTVKATVLVPDSLAQCVFKGLRTLTTMPAKTFFQWYKQMKSRRCKIGTV